MANHTILVGTNGGCTPNSQPIRKNVDTVEWQSESDKPCTVVFRGGGPFTKSNFDVPARGKGKSEQAKQRAGVELKVYDYDVNVPGGPSADPAIEIIA